MNSFLRENSGVANDIFEVQQVTEYPRVHFFGVMIFRNQIEQQLRNIINCFLVFQHFLDYVINQPWPELLLMRQSMQCFVFSVNKELIPPFQIVG